MKRVLQAIGISLGIHFALAAALAFFLSRAPEVDELTRLDFSSVELSFAEEENETAPVQPSPQGGAAARDVSLPSPDASEMPPVHGLTMDGPLPQKVTMPQPDPIPPESFTVASAVDNSQQKESAQSAPGSAPSIPAPMQARVDSPAKLTQGLKPDYPRRSREQGEHGDVVLELSVSDSGTVYSVKVAVSSGFPALDAAAVKAVRAAKLIPAKLAGKAVSSLARLTVQFRLKH